MSTNHQSTRERVLARLWQIADLSPEATRNNRGSNYRSASGLLARLVWKFTDSLLDQTDQRKR